ncbi:hypothetical protein INT46_001812 [Mucor plumbeus]|uniref:Uncharacterized protein n=1 Tax=Mucor plumbeus TaxID=97098 RepID=A0A8H7QS74_9FUNG|nr:hypothetical protein INT46_001812 [Mucor plumbeus]
MSYNYNAIQNSLAGSEDIRMKHLIKEACKEIMEEFVSRHSHLTLNKVMSIGDGLSMLEGKVDKLARKTEDLAVQVEILGNSVSSLSNLSSTGSSTNLFGADFLSSGSFSAGDNRIDLGFSGARRFISSHFPALIKKDINGKTNRVTPMDKIMYLIREQRGLLALDEDSEETKATKTKSAKFIKNQPNSFSLIVATELALEVDQANGNHRLNWGEIDSILKNKYYEKLEQIASPLCLPLQCCDHHWAAAALLSKSYENNHNIKKSRSNLDVSSSGSSFVNSSSSAFSPLAASLDSVESILSLSSPLSAPSSPEQFNSDINLNALIESANGGPSTDNVGAQQVQVAPAPRSRRGVRRNYVGNLAVPKRTM